MSGNRQLRIKVWPSGLPSSEHFEVVEADIPRLRDAEVLIRNRWISIDPYYRHALGPRFVGTPFCHPGDVMMGVTAGEVIESRDPRIPVGRLVTTRFVGMQDYCGIDGCDVRLLSEHVFGTEAGKLSLSTALGVAGIPGLTAYAALTEHARPKPGETFVVIRITG